ncbi:hypothetical protein AAHB61_15675 [Bacillus cereus]|nr:hypothetical protein [Bacillus cereus]
MKEIVDHILKLNVTHPTRVGVSGITASGKTTSAHSFGLCSFVCKCCFSE